MTRYRNTYTYPSDLNLTDVISAWPKLNNDYTSKTESLLHAVYPTVSTENNIQSAFNFRHTLLVITCKI